MKLLHVIGSMDPATGGPCQTIRNCAPWFVDQGNSLEVVCLNDPGADFLGHDPFPVHALGQGRGSWNYHPALLPWLKERMDQYDAVILNGLWQYQGYALWQAAQHPGAPPYYVFPHGMLDPWFQKLTVRPIKAARNWLLWKALMRHVAHDAAALLFTCEEEKRLARLPFRPYTPRQEVVVGLGVPDPPVFHEKMTQAFLQKCPQVDGAGFLLFLGRIHPKKGVDILIRAYSALCASVKGKRLPKLVIAGPGLETSYGKKMQQLAESLSLAHSVLWPGMLTGDAKWGATYNCEAFVLASHQENFGIAVVEALACGRPVLISNQVNIWREIQQSGAALVSANSVQATHRLLVDWTNRTPADQAAMADQAKPCFKKFFSIEGATRHLLDTIDAKRKAHDRQPSAAG
jgi:glycosyltransferase involved in cell wall biosynthesis